MKTAVVQKPLGSMTDRLDKYSADKRADAEGRYDSLVVDLADGLESIEPAFVDEVLHAAGKTTDNLEHDVREQARRNECVPRSAELERLTEAAAKVAAMIDREAAAWGERLAMLEQQQREADKSATRASNARAILEETAPRWLGHELSRVNGRIRKLLEQLQPPEERKTVTRYSDGKGSYDEPTFSERQIEHENLVADLQPELERLHARAARLDALRLTAAPRRSDLEQSDATAADPTLD